MGQALYHPVLLINSGDMALDGGERKWMDRIDGPVGVSGWVGEWVSTRKGKWDWTTHTHTHRRFKVTAPGACACC